jgi:hypothetical protein
VVDETIARIQTYIDDPIITVILDPRRCHLEVALALGFKISWKKVEGGSSIEWIGTRLAAKADHLSVTLPREKTQELLHRIQGMLASQATPAADLRRVLGQLSFLAGVIRVAKPSWHRSGESSRGSQNGASPSRLPTLRRAAPAPT